MFCVRVCVCLRDVDCGLCVMIVGACCVCGCLCFPCAVDVCCVCLCVFVCARLCVLFCVCEN